jgi:hypothetical protein
MAQWAGGEIDDPELTLKEQLDRLRSGGVEVTGISAHGDRRCYEHNISNYWCFSELRPVDPFAAENGRTAEGLMGAEPGYQIVYPKDDVLKRPDGSRYPLWSISMANLGLEYHAWHTQYDQYFSDSGGGWSRTRDPLDISRGNQRWQVLMHPIHWRGPGRRYFFLSTARSGSRWLSEMLNQATPLMARHEYILNQDYHRGEVSHKATANFRSLENNPDTVHARLREAWEELEKIQGDYAEVNVYLPTFVDQLRRIFPGAVFVHLYRHPAKVVRSLMDRDWYDTPEDLAHPRLKKADAAKLNRFERICQYVAETNERLLNACDYRVALEELTRSPDALAGALRRLEIPYHPRLGEHLVGTVINATRMRGYPSPENWSSDQRMVFAQLTGNSLRLLGYPSLSGPAHRATVSIKEFIRSKLLQWFRSGKRAVLRLRFRREIKVNTGRLRGTNCDVAVGAEGIVIRPSVNDSHAYLTLGGSGWHAVKGKERSLSGWPALPMTYVRGCLETSLAHGPRATLFAISYGKDGKQIYRRQLGIVDAQYPALEFSFAPHPDAKVFDIAVYFSSPHCKSELVIKRWCLNRIAHQG